MNNENFVEIYVKYQRFSAGIIYRIVKDRSVTEELCNEVFYHLYEKGDKIDVSNETRLKNLISRASRNKALDYVKKAYVIHEQCTLDDENWEEIADEEYAPEIRVLHMEESKYKKMVLARFRNKSPVNYEILMKAQCEGASPDEIAREYGFTRNNVNNRILRARKWITEELHKVYEN